MKKCDICGRESNRVVKLHGYSLCPKHMHQLLKYGKFLDNISRTNNDLNDYTINGNEVIFNVYGQDNIKKGEFVIDIDDIEKVKYHKWRFSHGHIVTGLPSRGTQRELSHVILGIKDREASSNIVVDHINGNPSDNRKRNLRKCYQKENVLNKKYMSNNTSNFIGVYYDKKRGMWCSEIRLGYVRCHFKRVATKEEAVYQRYIAEKILFKKFANKIGQRNKYIFTKNLTMVQKEEIEKYVKEKISQKFSGNKLY